MITNRCFSSQISSSAKEKPHGVSPVQNEEGREETEKERAETAAAPTAAEEKENRQEEPREEAKHKPKQDAESKEEKSGNVQPLLCVRVELEGEAAPANIRHLLQKEISWWRRKRGTKKSRRRCLRRWR